MAIEGSIKVTDAERSPCDIEGSIMKNYGILGLLKRFWCVLKGNKLFFFKYKGDLYAKGLVQIEAKTVVKKVNDKEFVVENMIGNHKSRDVFYCDTGSECKTWVDIIHRNISIFNGTAVVATPVFIQQVPQQVIYQGQPPPQYFQGGPPPPQFQGQPPPQYYQGGPPPPHFQGQPPPQFQGGPPPPHYQGQQFQGSPYPGDPQFQGPYPGQQYQGDPNSPFQGGPPPPQTGPYKPPPQNYPPPAELTHQPPGAPQLYPGIDDATPVSPTQTKI
ncbi:hypothetical protein SAMD00019534_108830 [Acytostelium subglobosum LB1]|uniref:hypothetical protein n=1 Tax=Acytostelium subglobosum LB1 TaxID=1410327 RepID=UPI0006451E16|nr:hypothetical protein SAMD00019534_108830 [Acytostelium subglobosum LB1]GAM27707.1 hypothetical protein SAMD00019534_108830 [Acytostelium subglobosum LB1]|eukprot:XP_012749366.1 hypothetical protein SAMD00019534_108830 [Acytostelium subglobosum LB1]